MHCIIGMMLMYILLAPFAYMKAREGQKLAWQHDNRYSRPLPDRIGVMNYFWYRDIFLLLGGTMGLLIAHKRTKTEQSVPLDSDQNNTT